MNAFISDPRCLLGAARALAADVDPWSDLVLCNPSDYREAGLWGDVCKIPIPKPATGRSSDLFAMSTHPLSRERLAEEADKLRANTHVVWLQPDAGVPRGELRTVVKS